MKNWSGKRIIIIGLAREGKALAQFAAAEGAHVVVSDARPRDRLLASLMELDGLKIDFVLGEHPMTLLDEADVLVLSPGVPADMPLAAAARTRGICVTNEPQEFLRRTPTAVIGITGSAGKTTTTSLTGHMGRVAGRNSWVGGNIGRPLITDLPQMQPGDFVVQELSSFQLELWTRSPAIAAILNITPNHLDRHRTMTAYINAKANILRYQAANDVAVLSADDPGCGSVRGLVRGRLRLFSAQQPVDDGAFVRDGHIWLRDGERETAVCPLNHIQLRGGHNILNVLAATTLADAAGIPVAAMAEAIHTFHGVAHRLELVRLLNGVHYINDSIATAPERALAALNAFTEPIVLLAGGRDKDMQWETWAQVVPQRTKQVILFGQLGEMLEGLLDSPVVRVNTLAEAVGVAAKTAVSGDIVLLSPGGTSYDAYNDFVERGEHFRALVQALLP
ncbi:MAG: UDP-N-acetylmuramoyl-L-alanine--D-glutamate ligase [Ardenticatenaceae bacterium]|nr:UDP-N-acetylmuramoyl-L-alanine--D-glutamate ligase [Ardenticatenaceae bacterium]